MLGSLSRPQAAAAAWFRHKATPALIFKEFTTFIKESWAALDAPLSSPPCISKAEYMALGCKSSLVLHEYHPEVYELFPAYEALKTAINGFDVLDVVHHIFHVLPSQVCGCHQHSDLNPLCSLVN